ncbi:MFS transporter, partial [Burkholderia cenocepacia]
LMMPAYYMMGAALIGIVSVVALAETARQPLKGSPPAVATRREAHQLARQLREEDDEQEIYGVATPARA